MTFRSRIAGLGMFVLTAAIAGAQTTNLAITTPVSSTLPDTGASIFRVFGAFVLVIAIFLGGVWLFRNWQRLAVQKTGGARLNLIEVKSLGQRQAIYVIGYQQQRMLVASSPAGISLLSHLPNADESAETAIPVRPGFAQALQQVLSRKA